MKRCPECRRDYYDDTLSFCLEDGTPLIFSGSENEPATALLGVPLSSGYGYDEQKTQALGTGLSGEKPLENGTSHTSIAVLPFVNMSADTENEYFCDGLAEELLNALAKIDDLKVAARTASFSFRGKNAPMAEIGRTLNVNSILEGSVRKSGSRVRITVQLINAMDGYHLWSERYDRDMQDIFEVQDEITLAVVDALKLKLLGAEKQAVLKRHTNDPEAYQLYLRGRFFFFKRTPEGFRKAIEYFERAIEMDEKYAVAISGLADSHVFLGFYEMVPPREAAAKLKPLVRNAIEIDATLAETNVSAALLCSLYEWKFSESLKYYDAAISYDANYPFIYHLQSATLILLGDHERAFEAEKRAIELDPFTPVFNASLGWWYYLAGQNDDAIAQSKRTIEIAPNHFFAYWILGLSYAVQEAFADSVVAFQQALALNQFDQHVRADLARVFGLMGEHEEALGILAALEELLKTHYVSPVNIAKIHTGLGERDTVIEQLDKACEERSVRLPWFMIDPALDGYRDDPRFKQISRRVGLPD